MKKFVKIKKSIKKIPVVSWAAKLVYDGLAHRQLKSKIKKFLARELPFSEKAPLKYAIGHEPTIRCNLKCKMCYQGQTRALRRSELATDEVLEVYDKLKEKVKEIKLVGGEPFVRQDIFKLVEFWDKNQKRIILQTNCTLLDEKTVGELKKYKQVTDILTSLDGPREMHDAIRGVAGSFDKLKKAIGLIQIERPDIPITIFATLLLEDNVSKLKELIDTCKLLKVRTINILFEQVYTSEEVEISKKILEKKLGWGADSYLLNTQIREPVFKAGVNSAKIRWQLFKMRLYGLLKGCFVNYVPFDYYLNVGRYLTGQGKRSFCLKLLSPELRINQRGEVIWCDIIEKSFGNLLEKTPDEIWQSEDYQKFRNFLFNSSLPICRRCCKASYID